MVFHLRLVQYVDEVQLVSNMNIYRDYSEIQQGVLEHQHDMVQHQHAQVQTDELLKDSQ
jgi:deferrochelatase/peroxidase EfeB